MSEDLQVARSIREIIVDLSKPLDPAHLKTRRQGGAQLTYIEWHTAVRYLDLFAPGWSYHVKSVSLVGDLVTVIASISISCAEGTVTREATGCEESDARGYGDACSNSEAMALKRAAAKFGLGLSLYQKGDSQPIASTKSNGRQSGGEGESAASERIRLAKEKAGLQKAAPKDQYEAIVADTGPSKNLMKNPKYPPATGEKLGAACKRLVAHGVSGEELLREVNYSLTSFGKDPVQSRYELDDESAIKIAESFNKFADTLDVKARLAKV